MHTYTYMTCYNERECFLQLTLQVLSGDQLRGDEHGGDLHHQFGVGQPPPAPQRVRAQHRQALRHEHPPVRSKTRKQHVSEVPSSDPAPCTAVLHRTNL